MCQSLIVALCCLVTGVLVAHVDPDPSEWRQNCDPSPSNQTIYEFSLENVWQNETFNLSDYSGKVLLLMNVATYCQHIMQMASLNGLVAEFGDDGFEAIAVPCNQFHSMEPAWNGEELMGALEFVRPGNGFIPDYFLSWTLEVNGANEHPLFTYLKPLCPPVESLITTPIAYEPVYVDDVRWNFEKFLIGRDGKPVRRYSHYIDPATDDGVKDDIREALAVNVTDEA